MREQEGDRRTLVREGQYHLSAPLALGNEDAGEQIAAYPGEHPVFYGGLPVTAWQPSGVGVSAPLPTALSADAGLPTLLADGGAAPNARLPPEGARDDARAWFFAESAPPGIDTHRSFRVRAADIPLLAALPAGAVVSIFGQRGWQDNVLPIKTFETSSRVVTLEGTSWDDLGEGSRFAIMNAPPTPGTWRLDPGSGRIQLWPLAGHPRWRSIVAATLPCVVSIAGTHDIVLSGLEFAGSATEGAAVCLSQTKRIGLDHLAIRYTGDGIRLDGAAETRITRSEISQTGGFGIVLRNRSDGTKVEGNWLHEIGLLHQDASAIWFDASSNNRFSHNRIEDVAKFGIGGGSLTSGAATGNFIEGNEIDRANQRTSDGGAIMVIGWGQDITRDLIRGNFITATSALGNMGWDGKVRLTFQDPVTRLVSEAIYLDDWASGVEVSGNLLCGNIGGIDLHAGWNNRVIGNVVLSGAGIALSADAVEWLGPGAHPHAMQDNDVERNTVLVDRASTGQSGVASLGGGQGAARFENNFYGGPGLNGMSFHQTPDSIWSSYSFGIRTWQRRGQDRRASVGLASLQVSVDAEAVRVTGVPEPPAILPLAAIGRPADRSGLADRIRQRCGLR